MIDSNYLLTDEQMRHFISHGYVVLKTDFPRSFHENLHKTFEEIVDKEGNPGNNALPRVPEISEVFEHPIIRGGLTSVLGPNYIMHPHRHCHFSKPGRQVQNWHKDSYWGYRKVRNHHNWWAMIFYYPQDVTEEMGPSAILPGTQYYNRRYTETEVDKQILGEAGTFALIHYDLWHRGTENISNQNRTMMKFQFVRMDAPTEPAWNNQHTEWTAMNGDGPPTTHEALWRHQWNWHRGQQLGNDTSGSGNGHVSQLIDALNSQDPMERLATTDELGMMGAAAAEAIPALINTLKDKSEPVAVNASYALAAMGDDAHAALLEALQTTNKAATRNAGYGLSAVGSSVLSGLIDTLSHKSELARGYGSFALGELGVDAQEATSRLAQLSRNDSVWVRRNAVEALGTIKDPAQTTVPALADALSDEDVQVRFTSALSLTRIGEAADPAVPALTEALKDENRYVRANASDALVQIGTPAAYRAALDYLKSTRWCPTTTPENLFYP